MLLLPHQDVQAQFHRLAFAACPEACIACRIRASSMTMVRSVLVGSGNHPWLGPAALTTPNSHPGQSRANHLNESASITVEDQYP